MIDSFGREITYLRLSVTDHCNMACTYCREEDEKTKTKKVDILSYEEIYRIVSIFADLGISKVRITGGEPLMRKDLTKMIKMMGTIEGINEIPLSTNAELLENNATELKAAGIDRVNISIDSLDISEFKDITRGGDLTKVIKGLDKALEVGMHPIKINVVAKKTQRNKNQIEDMMDFALQRGIDIRFIEMMPLGKAGIESSSEYISRDEILDRVNKHLGKKLRKMTTDKNAGPSDDYAIEGESTRVGIIGAVSCNFCDSCNRIRMTAKGVLILCLGQEYSLDIKKLIRDGETDDYIKKKILMAIDKKPERHFFDTDKNNAIEVKMVELGG